MTSDPATVTELEELMAAIRGYDDPRRAGGQWKQVHRALRKTSLPSGSVAHAVGMRDVGLLAELIEQLRAPDPAAAPEDADVPSAATCKRALRAFRKRLTLTCLDEESKLGRGPLSKGSGSSSPSITTPVEFTDSVWGELVRQGKLRYVGHGFYELPKPVNGSERR